RTWAGAPRLSERWPWRTLITGTLCGLLSAPFRLPDSGLSRRYRLSGEFVSKSKSSSAAVTDADPSVHPASGSPGTSPGNVHHSSVEMTTNEEAGLLPGWFRPQCEVRGGRAPGPCFDAR